MLTFTTKERIVASADHQWRVVYRDKVTYMTTGELAYVLDDEPVFLEAHKQYGEEYTGEYPESSIGIVSVEPIASITYTRDIRVKGSQFLIGKTDIPCQG